jgi:hypothetical protein
MMPLQRLGKNDFLSSSKLVPGRKSYPGSFFEAAWPSLQAIMEASIIKASQEK